MNDVDAVEPEEDPELAEAPQPDQEDPEAAEAGEATYTMTVDMSVLEALGINLYSNAAAVLSEMVANAYDADATQVAIDWQRNGRRIVISDDGCGMTVAEINRRFLTVGYSKRKHEGTESPRFKRPFMGRKGIGKLSVFSIARTVRVYTTKDGSSHGLVIRVGELEQAIEDHRAYHPDPEPVPQQHQRPGTTLILEDLKTKRADITASALRKRLARRFDVLDDTPAAQGGFSILINENPIGWADRVEFNNLEFVWQLGGTRLPDVLPKGVTRFDVPGTVDHDRGWTVRGWFGTAKTPSDLTADTEAGSLKNIIVLARKRPIQEGIVDKLDFSRLFGNYVTGQIEADFLDLDDGYDDIATSDRQRLIEDDPRVEALQAYMRDAFVKAADQWTELRPKKELPDALARYPRLRAWVDGLPPTQRPLAESMLGTIASLAFEPGQESDRAALFRSGVLAFARVGLRQTAGELERLRTVQASDLLFLLGQQDEYEAGLWADILRSRVEAIDQLKQDSEDDVLENVLQRHLFEHLWLLDPSWERATAGGHMEEDLRRKNPQFKARDSNGNEIKGRYDIRYAKAAGDHVIVELKRYERRVTLDELLEQGRKYYDALDSILDQEQAKDRHIEVVFVLGRKVKVGSHRGYPDERTAIAQRLTEIHGRVVYIDEMIRNARYQYEAYLDASRTARELDELLADLDGGSQA